MRRKPKSRIGADWARKAGGWSSPEQVVEGMFGLSRGDNEGPLQIFLTVSEIDRERAPDHRLSAQTVRLLADKFADFNDQYLIFSEFHDLNDNSIARFLSVAEGLDRIADHSSRSSAIGIFQADVGFWEILARQGQIPGASLNDSWQGLLAPFPRVATPPANLRRRARGARPNRSRLDGRNQLLGKCADLPSRRSRPVVPGSGGRCTNCSPTVCAP